MLHPLKSSDQLRAETFLQIHFKWKHTIVVTLRNLFVCYFDHLLRVCVKRGSHCLHGVALDKWIALGHIAQLIKGQEALTRQLQVHKALSIISIVVFEDSWMAANIFWVVLWQIQQMRLRQNGRPVCKYWLMQACSQQCV